MSMVKVFYDATYAVSSKRGMGQYAKNLISVIKEFVDLDIIGLSPSNSEVLEGGIRFGFSNVILWEQVSLPRFLAREKNVKCCIFPYNTAPIILSKRFKSIVVVHDLIFMEPIKTIKMSASFKQNLGRIYRRLVVPLIIKRADFIITVSEFTKVQIIKRFKIHSNNVYVIPNTIDDCFFNNTPTESPKDEPYILNVGGDAPHKNIANLICAYERLSTELKTQYSLKILGVATKTAQNQLLSLVKDEKLKKRIVFLHHLSTDEVVDLYRKASCFVFPSLYEGFGIPLLEAMATGCPIVCSNTSSLPEVAGDSAFYFDPLDVEDMSNKIALVLQNKEFARMLSSKGNKRVEYYRKKAFQLYVKSFVEVNIC